MFLGTVEQDIWKQAFLFLNHDNKRGIRKKIVKYFIILMGKISSQENDVKVYIGKYCSPTYLVPICRFDWQTYEGSVCVCGPVAVQRGRTGQVAIGIKTSKQCSALEKKAFSQGLRTSRLPPINRKHQRNKKYQEENI